MIYHFPEDITFEGPSEFTDPFRYTPHPLVRFAASEVLKELAVWKDLPSGCPEADIEAQFAEGKMLGVLVCRKGPELCYIKAFSGNIGARSVIEGFVPPIYDLTVPSGEFRLKEAEITAMNLRIQKLSGSEELVSLQSRLKETIRMRDEEISMMRSEMIISKQHREKIRKASTDPSVLTVLIKESQFEKAQLKRAKEKWAISIHCIQSQLDCFTTEIDKLKKERARMSDILQEWIFNQYIVHNALGEDASIIRIFTDSGLIPPGGTGECAAPKLLDYAYRNGLLPLAMGEFWYGRSPETAVRTHGHFYPSCTSKCGPLLGFMMKGLSHQKDRHDQSESAYIQTPVILHEDETLIIVEKPSGMPSVPGLDGRLSLQEWIVSNNPVKQLEEKAIHAVHRLDMDTSGVMIFAKTEETAICLRKQFEEHTIKKTYMARLSAEPHSTVVLAPGKRGKIDLPLSADYDERPRQKVDFTQGKDALTEYEVTGVQKDGCIDIVFYPHTGRTHQLRVHSAHTLGLGHPILGDLLYGSYGTRLHLHALSITFHHPVTAERITFTSEQLSY